MSFIALTCSASCAGWRRARLHGDSHDPPPHRRGWGTVIRRILGAAMRTLPLLAVLFIPVILGIRRSTFGPAAGQRRRQHLREHLEQITQTYLT